MNKFNSNQQDIDQWDIIIKPKSTWLYLNIRELISYRDLLWLWVRRDYISAYQQTILGPIWHFLSQVFSTIICVIVFGKLAKLPTDGIPMFLFYNAGITIWNFFNGCFNASSGAFISNASIFGKVYFPRIIIPLASTISMWIKFCFQMILFLVVYFWMLIFSGYHPEVGWGLLYIPLSLILVGGIGFGLGLMISAITIKYRDLNQLIGFGIQIFLYSTPIIYAYSAIPDDMKKWLKFNPLVAPIESFKYAFFGVGTFDAGSLFYSFSWLVVSILVGLLLFNRAERNFMDIV